MDNKNQLFLSLFILSKNYHPIKKNGKVTPIQQVRIINSPLNSVKKPDDEVPSVDFSAVFPASSLSETLNLPSQHMRVWCNQQFFGDSSRDLFGMVK